jgi:hypothetical protein
VIGYPGQSVCVIFIGVVFGIGLSTGGGVLCILLDLRSWHVAYAYASEGGLGPDISWFIGSTCILSGLIANST